MGQRKVRHGWLLCHLIGHKFTMGPDEPWQYHRRYVIGHCIRCDLIAMKIWPFTYWNEYGVLFSVHREKGRELGLLDKWGWIDEYNHDAGGSGAE